jgi:thiamine biosynthesis lipoprotein
MQELQIGGTSLRRARPLLGTIVEIAVAGCVHSAMEAAVEAAFAAIATVHRLMSFHESTSDVSRLNRGAHAAPVLVHDWTCEVLRVAADLLTRSDGAFNIGVAPVLQTLGTLPVDQNAEPATTIIADELFELLPGNHVRFLHPHARIDLGGIAKGFAVDRAIEVLRRHGLPRGLVNAGGDLRAFGPEAYTIHIRDPRNPSQSICQVSLCNSALASTGGRFDPFRSADLENCTIIDPETHQPVRRIRGATVSASSCLIADALTKVVMIQGERAAPLLDYYAACALFVSDDGQVRTTSSWLDIVGLAA